MEILNREGSRLSTLRRAWRSISEIIEKPVDNAIRVKYRYGSWACKTVLDPFIHPQSNLGPYADRGSSGPKWLRIEAPRIILPNFGNQVAA